MVTDQDVWALLERVGLARPGQGAGARTLGSPDTLRDPLATERLAQILAERLGAERPDLVVVWEGLHSAILGYAVGLRVGAPVIVFSDDEGLVTASAPVRAGARAVLVAPRTPDDQIRRMVGGYLESRGAYLSAVATLLGTAGADTLALAELPPEAEAETPGLSQAGGGDGNR